MKYRSFGKTGWQVSEISLGGAYIAGSDPSRAEQNAVEVIHRALELGVNYINRSQNIIERLCKEPGTLAQNAFQYILADPRVSTVSSGAANIQELEDVVQASDMGAMSKGLIKELHQARPGSL